MLSHIVCCIYCSLSARWIIAQLVLVMKMLSLCDLPHLEMEGVEYCCGTAVFLTEGQHLRTHMIVQHVLWR